MKINKEQFHEWLERIICIILSIFLVVGIIVYCHLECKYEEDHHIYSESGVCPDCGTPLEKYVTEHYGPTVWWSCPKCD